MDLIYFEVSEGNYRIVLVVGEIEGTRLMRGLNCMWRSGLTIIAKNGILESTDIAPWVLYGYGSSLLIVGKGEECKCLWKGLKVSDVDQIMN